jgi:hypothetical protein
MNWSCAYDSAMTIAASTFLHIRSELRHPWSVLGETSSLLCQLLHQVLPYIPWDYSILDGVRDRLRDHFTSIDPLNFPRVGPALAQCSSIVERLFTNPNEHQLHLPLHCETHSCNFLWSPSILSYEIISSSVMESLHSNTSTHISTQDYLLHSITQRNRTNPLYVCSHLHSSTLMTPCRVSLSSSVDSLLPPFLVFELYSYPSFHFIPSLYLSLSPVIPSLYKLRGVVYSGHQHFTARVSIDNVVLDYDGQIQAGQLLPTRITSNLDWSSMPGNRQPHLLIYSLF